MPFCNPEKNMLLPTVYIFSLHIPRRFVGKHLFFAADKCVELNRRRTERRYRNVVCVVSVFFCVATLCVFTSASQSLPCATWTSAASLWTPKPALWKLKAVSGCVSIFWFFNLDMPVVHCNKIVCIMVHS